LLEFAEVPPDYLKFDISFIHDIDTSPESKRLVLRSLVSAATDLGVLTIAEGIETEAEAVACEALGFSHAQGYLFGRAIPADQV
jgi:EAL domain-containing protein (putative c-di-GMP-specific phosphodiesterase class I)